MGKTISFTVDDTDYPGILEYARRKGHRTASNLARYALYAMISRNPAGRHDSRHKQESRNGD